MPLLSGCGDAHSASVQVEQLKQPIVGDQDLDDKTAATGKLTLSPEQLEEIKPTTSVVQQRRIAKEVS